MPVVLYLVARLSALFGRGSCLLALVWWNPTQAGLPETIEQVRPSVVGVGVLQRHLRTVSSTFSGTGFVVGDGTRVVTNYHVYKSLQKLRDAGGQLVVFSGRGKKAKALSVRLARVDERHDLAVLKLQEGRLPALRLADDGMRREGESVAFTGFPIGMVLGLYPATHRGIISAITPIVIPASSGRHLTPEQVKRIRDTPFEVYQLDGTAYPGNSGSPVYDTESGKVIGVINSVFVKGTKEAAIEKPSGITYAIPVRYVRALLRDGSR